uniref:Uncharacterized protein n=1 Tax=Anopheles atroparvus TaxID=41427 RepID=A0AAG5D2R1_ANOAO
MFLGWPSNEKFMCDMSRSCRAGRLCRKSKFFSCLFSASTSDRRSVWLSKAYAPMPVSLLCRRFILFALRKALFSIMLMLLCDKSNSKASLWPFQCDSPGPITMASAPAAILVMAFRLKSRCCRLFSGENIPTGIDAIRFSLMFSLRSSVISAKVLISMRSSSSFISAMSSTLSPASL